MSSRPRNDRIRAWRALLEWTPVSPSSDPDRLLAHAEFLHRLTRRLVADSQSADDVEQETWLAALGGRPPSQPSRARAWLSVVARNAARRMHRDGARRTRREAAVARPEAGDDRPPGDAARLHRVLVDAVLALDDLTRTALIERFLDGRPPREIARRTGASPDAVRSRIRRGLAEVRLRIGRKGAAGAGMLGFASARPAHATPAISAASAVGGAIVGTHAFLASAAAAALLVVALGAVTRPEPPPEVGPVLEAADLDVSALDARAAAPFTPELAVPPRRARAVIPEAVQPEPDSSGALAVGFAPAEVVAEAIEAAPTPEEARRSKLAAWLETAKDRSGVARDSATRMMILHAVCEESAVDAPGSDGALEADLRSTDLLTRARAAGAAPRRGAAALDAMFELVSDPTAGPLRGAAILRLHDVQAARERLLRELPRWLDDDDPTVRAGAYAVLPYVGVGGGAIAVERANRGDVAEEWIDLLGQAVAWSGVLADPPVALRSASLVAATRRWVRPEFDLTDDARRRTLATATHAVLAERDTSSEDLIGVLATIREADLADARLRDVIDDLSRGHADSMVRHAAAQAANARAALVEGRAMLVAPVFDGRVETSSFAIVAVGRDSRIRALSPR